MNETCELGEEISFTRKVMVEGVVQEFEALSPAYRLYASDSVGLVAQRRGDEPQRLNEGYEVCLLEYRKDFAQGLTQCLIALVTGIERRVVARNETYRLCTRLRGLIDQQLDVVVHDARPRVEVAGLA